MEGLLSEWIHLEWKNRRERFRQHCSDEVPQADVELAGLLRRVCSGATLWLCPCKFTQPGVLKWGFFLLASALFPLFRKVHACVFVCTQWLYLLTKLCKIQKFTSVPPNIYTAPGETQKCFTNHRFGMESFVQNRLHPLPWGHVTATHGQQQQGTRDVNIRRTNLFLSFSIPLNASKCFACVCNF